MCKQGLKIEEINVCYNPRSNPDEKNKSIQHVQCFWAMFKVRYF